MKRDYVYIATEVVLSLFLISCSTPNYKIADWEKYELKGKVKTLVIKRFETSIRFGEVVKGNLTDSTIISFNPDGRLNKIVDYNSGTSLDGEKLYLCIKYVDTYKYTATKAICDYSGYGNEKYDGKKVVFYNEWGGIDKEITYDANGREDYFYEYEYNDEHQLIEESFYSDGKLSSKDKFFEYDENGLLKKYKAFDSNGKLNRVEYIEYNDAGRMIKEYCKVEDKYISRSNSYAYNQEGFRSLLIMDNQSMHHEVNFKYEYDDKGNYIVKYSIGETTIRGRVEQVSGLEEREITYY